jgi:hypothetical protein
MIFRKGAMVNRIRKFKHKIRSFFKVSSFFRKTRSVTADFYTSKEASGREESNTLKLVGIRYPIGAQWSIESVNLKNK